MPEKKYEIKHPDSKAAFKKLINGKKPVLVDFFATWCGPCQMMGPILEEMAKTYKNIDKVEIAKVDIDEISEVASEFNVMSVPTFILFRDGKEAEKMVGMRPAAEFESKLDELIK